MTPSKVVRNRANNPIRKAFEAAASGLYGYLGAECYPTVTSGTGERKVARALGSADADDLNPSWWLLDEIARQRAEVLLNTLSDELGFERPRRLAPDPAQTLDRLLNQLQGMERQLNAIGAQVDTVSKATFAKGRRVEPGRVRRTG